MFILKSLGPSLRFQLLLILNNRLQFHLQIF